MQLTLPFFSWHDLLPLTLCNIPCRLRKRSTPRGFSGCRWFCVRFSSLQTTSRSSLRRFYAVLPFFLDLSQHSLQVEEEKYTKGVQWLQEFLYWVHFTADRIKIVAQKILWNLANFLDLSPVTFPNIPCRLRKRSTPRGSSGCRRFCIRFSSQLTTSRSLLFFFWHLAIFLDLSHLTFPNNPCRLRKRSTPRGSSGCRRFCIRFNSQLTTWRSLLFFFWHLAIFLDLSHLTFPNIPCRLRKRSTPRGSSGCKTFYIRFSSLRIVSRLLHNNFMRSCQFSWPFTFDLSQHSLQVEEEKYTKGVQWLQEILYQIQFTADRIKIVPQKILCHLAKFLDLLPLTFPNIPCRLKKRSTPRGSSGCRRFCIRFSSLRTASKLLLRRWSMTSPSWSEMGGQSLSPFSGTWTSLQVSMAPFWLNWLNW